ncbi:MAG: hypothetical protein RBS57_10035 [Desulforhabdus sp.]|jgi:hypothetical protein|nr:hypothetical protein [Desulforhabdus sp.]
MKDKQSSLQMMQADNHDTFFRLINPDEFARYGIDAEDVPMGTFAAEDHPGFLPSRLGGNAYGLGLIEQTALSKADTDFLESLDYQDILELGRHSKRLNAIYHKLGLLIRFSQAGQRYFLIPINLVAHSLQDVKIKADEIEELILEHALETATERLDIGLLTAGHDLIVHELTARLSSHRIFLFESLEKIRSWRLPLDIVILPKDIFEYLLEQQLPKVSRAAITRKRLINYAAYLAGKLYDLLESQGKLIMLSNSFDPKGDQTCEVRFRSDEELKLFLLFCHIYKTRQHYDGKPGQPLRAHVSDLHYYLNRFAFSEPHLKRLLNQKKPEQLTIEQVNQLEYLNLRLPQAFIKDAEKKWKWVIEPYFATSYRIHDSTQHSRQYWQDRLELDCRLPEGLAVLIGRPRQPRVSLEKLEEELKASGMQGCSLQLIAEYRNTIRYLLDVLKTLAQIRSNDFPKLSELERARLANPFNVRVESFEPVLQLLNQILKIEKVREILNPDHIDGQSTPILESIHKLSLLGFSPDQLREILLIVVGHTTMSRIVFGKLPAKTLKPITDKARAGNYQEILSRLRVCRLMSMAEIAAAFGDTFTGEQARELYRLYDDAIYVATNPNLDWDNLHDLRISTLGGAQNKAVREMLKFFNLFEFLDTWQEFLDKSSMQKEVFCDYHPEKLAQLDEALCLARIANQFKQQFLGDYVFGKFYFFRQFLDTEFHGTGHLFPRLGTKAGFILLWITVNASKRHVINFNPLLAGIPADRHEQRINKIKETLLRIPIERLQPRFFEDIQRTLSEDRPAFIFDTGIRVMNNHKTRAVDVSFVDVDENIRQLEVLLTHLESQELRGISLRNLQDMERLFSEVESFHAYLDREGCDLQCDIFAKAGGVEAKNNEIETIEQRLQIVLRSQIFVPEEIYDNISVLAKHCPEILRFILPELHAFGNLIENWPTRQKQMLGAYVMRCIEKFQALIVKDRNGFQDRNTFYQLAKQEFGPLAEEGIGATHAQMETLEYLVDRIQQRPAVYQSLTMALLFQEIAKIETYAEALPDHADWWTHAEAGALILERSEVLEKYQLGSQVEELVILLVRYHGLIGHVILGEEPIISLEHLTANSDKRVLDVFVLHAILAAAAVQEGLMVADLLDAFLSFRAVALEIIKSKSNWQSWLKETFRETGRAVLADSQVSAHQIGVFPADREHYCSFADVDMEDDALWRGRQISALERLLKLMGATWIDYQDIQMYLLKMPVNFIYHKKKLKSVGLATFEKQLKLALRLLDVLSTLSAEMRFYLFYCLDHLGAGIKMYDFHLLASFIDLEDSLKLLVLALRAFHQHFGEGIKKGLISFRHLSQNVEQHQEALRILLKQIPLPQSCDSAPEPFYFPQAYGGILFLKSRHQPVLQVRYQEAVQLDEMIQSMTSKWDQAELANLFHELVEQLRQNLPYDTNAIEKELKKVYLQQQEKINDLILKEIQEHLNKVRDFPEFQRVQEDIAEKQSTLHFSEEQRSLLEEMCDYHSARIREAYLDSIYLQINEINSKDRIQSYWNELKHELFSYRSYLGKEYESLIAEFIDQKLQELEPEPRETYGEINEC